MAGELSRALLTARGASSPEGNHAVFAPPLSISIHGAWHMALWITAHGAQLV